MNYNITMITFHTKFLRFKDLINYTINHVKWLCYHTITF